MPLLEKGVARSDEGGDVSVTWLRSVLPDKTDAKLSQWCETLHDEVDTRERDDGLCHTTHLFFLFLHTSFL